MINKKILIFSNLYYPNQHGGAEITTQLIAEGLNSNGLIVEVITTATDTKYSNKTVNGILVHYYPIRNLYSVADHNNQKWYKKIIWHILDSFNVFNFWGLLKLIDKIRPEIAITNCISGFSVIVWLILRLKKISVVHVIHDYYLLCFKCRMYEKNSNCKKRCIVCKILSVPPKIMSRFVTVVVGVSQFVLDSHLNNGYFKKSLHKIVIYNPIKSQKIVVAKEKKTKPIFGFVGRLSREKGLEMLCDVFIKNSDYILLIFGTTLNCQYLDKLYGKYDNFGNIHFMGKKSHLEIYSNIDVLIVPSLWNEPFGRIIPEAYEYGIPVIGSKRGGIPEIVINEKTGLIFNPDNKYELEECLNRFYNNNIFLSNTSQRAKQMYETFEYEHIVNKYVNLIS
jgi:glycosyltransferase involved in cell wall biosynthesis